MYKQNSRIGRHSADRAAKRAWRWGLLTSSALTGLALTAGYASAQQWTGATSSDYTIGSNWSGGSVPNSNVASVIFGAGASTTTVDLNQAYSASPPQGLYSAGTVTFNDPGSAYTVNVSNTAYLNIFGGVTNTSGTTQNFTVTGDSGSGAGSFINFQNADAGSNVVYTVNAYGGLAFYSGANASGANATFVLNGGSISLSGSGTLTLGSVEGSGVLSYYGNPSGSTGTFQIGGVNADTTTLDAQIQEQDGVLSIEKVGSGTLRLTGASTYSGGTILSGGTLLIGNDAALGSGGLTMAGGTTFGASGGARIFAQTVTLDGSATIDTSDGDLTLSSGIGESGGPASLTKTGSGTLTLNGASTYTGGTNLYAGTLSLDDNNALGTGWLSAFDGTVIDIQDGVTINNNMTIDVSQIFNVGSGATGTYAGQIFEFGDPSTIVKTGGGTLVLTNNGNSFGSGADIKEGTLQVTGNHVLGTGPITLDGGTLQAGADNLDLPNTFLQFTANGGAIDTQAYDLSIGATMADIDTPSGTFTKKGSGTLTITGTSGGNNYSTATDVAEGTLKADATNIFSAYSAYTVESGATLSLNNFSQAIGSLAGAGTVDNGSAKLTTGGNGKSTIFSGTLSGSGGLTKMGSGTFELSGASTLSGTTEVEAGTLLVSGSLGGSAVKVDGGATLGGGGTIKSLDVSGTVAPGNNAIGTLTVNGAASFQSGSTYAVELNSAGLSDLIDASGAATIASGAGLTVTNVGAGGLVAGTRYTVLEASSVSGTFTVNNPQLSAFLSATAVSDATHAYVDIDQTKSFGSAGLTPNQIAAGAGLDSAAGSALTSAVLALPSDAAAQDAFDQLSGELHASAKGALVQDSHFLQDAVTARLRAAFGDSGTTAALPVMAYGEDGVQPVTADTDRFAVWGQGFGSWGGADSNGDAAAFDRSTGGFLMGADGMMGDWRVGLVGGYSHTSFDVDDRHSSGDSDNYHLGVYGGTNWGSIALRTGAAYSWHRISTSRSVAFQGFADQLSADYDAGTAQAFGELAYRTDAGPFAFEPFANLAYVNLHTDGFAETGGAAAVTSASSTTDATFTTLGVRASTDVTLGGISATARGMFGWRHTYGDVMPTSTFAFAGGDDFSIAGVPIARDAMLVEVGFDVRLAANMTLGLSYAGQFGPDAFDNGFKANLGVKF
ncbi:autotransporter outer membrane beta-barrel domain-containing protein [Mesorhizobium sp. BH1-1-5]|uniref:autotransporter domain-containing protein n=1 Tax=Mesorhizobium sp. BH1-1-5 TaxID=2876661 RepID=UPI001CCCBE36|nr:autotransporter domain-containing protein [Mesorhizobium sp. BH1-1-5]MBZ9986200.1 autotransporter outer membrane beta-barrel domain-containing protein [Mesorhizobium sp. BH1-1-5]